MSLAWIYVYTNVYAVPNMAKGGYWILEIRVIDDGE